MLKQIAGSFLKVFSAKFRKVDDIIPLNHLTLRRVSGDKEFMEFIVQFLRGFGCVWIVPEEIGHFCLRLFL
jgi:hypothetical protein